MEGHGANSGFLCMSIQRLLSYRHSTEYIDLLVVNWGSINRLIILDTQNVVTV